MKLAWPCTISYTSLADNDTILAYVPAAMRGHSDLPSIVAPALS